MRRFAVTTALVSLFAMPLGGCVSQNAMATLPDDVKLAVAADQLRNAQEAEPEAAKAEKPSVAKSAKAERPKLSQAEIMHRASAKAEREPETSTATAGETRDPRAMFEMAMQMRGGGKAQPSDEPAAYEPAYSAAQPAANEPVADPSDGRAAWEKFMSMNGGKTAAAAAPNEAAAIDDSIKTAAVEQPAARPDVVEFMFADDGAAIDTKGLVQLRLMQTGGRKPRRIVVGKIAEGDGFEVLRKAQARASVAIAATGGDPGMSYDPTMSANSAFVEYEPFAIR